MQLRRTPVMLIQRAGQSGRPSSKWMVRSRSRRSMVSPDVDRQRSAAQGRRSLHRATMAFPPSKGRHLAMDSSRV